MRPSREPWARMSQCTSGPCFSGHQRTQNETANIGVTVPDREYGRSASSWVLVVEGKKHTAGEGRTHSAVETVRADPDGPRQQLRTMRPRAISRGDHCSPSDAIASEGLLDDVESTGVLAGSCGLQSDLGQVERLACTRMARSERLWSAPWTFVGVSLDQGATYRRGQPRFRPLRPTRNS